MAGTTTGIEPLYAVAFKRRYLKGRKEWHYQYVIDGTAKILINEYGIDPNEIETALSLSGDPERRIKFQADVQDYVDMSISSTINMPKWGTEMNNDTLVDDFAHILAKYAHRLRGFTCYPDGARGGQPLTIVDYDEARKHEGTEFKEQFHDICSIQNRAGVCGV
jgi:ribonucleoside-diphosphate reductase alpha chain